MRMTTSWKKRFSSLYKSVRGKFHLSKSGTGSSFHHVASLGMPSQAYSRCHSVFGVGDSHIGAGQLNRGCHSVSSREHGQGDGVSGDPAWDVHIPPPSQAPGWSYFYSSYGMSFLGPFMGQPGLD